MTAHIKLAREQGPKAGFNAYMASNIHTAADRREQIRSAGNKKAQFEAYCALFGSQFGPVKGAGAIRAEAQREDVRESGLLARLAALVGVDTDTLAAKLNTVEVPVVETPVEKPAPVATRITWPMFWALVKAGKKAGVEVKITDKLDKGSYAVSFDGENLTPEQASEIIGASKNA